MILFLVFASSAFAATHVVEMRNFSFQPPNIIINQGDTVIWTNSDSQFHNTVSGTNLVRSGYWASPLFGRGGTFAVTFTNIPPGGYGYYCEPHLLTFGMKGIVTIIAPPSVSINSPTNGAQFPVGADVPLLASASDADGVVTQVEFFSGNDLLGIATDEPFGLLLTNIASGNYTFTARAHDDSGLISTSAPAIVSVEAPPVVNLTSPTNGTRIPLGEQILLAAQVFGGGGSIASVEFFANETKLGETIVAPYEFPFSPATATDFQIFAIASDSLNQRGTSAPVSIRVFVPENTRPTLTITSAPPNFVRLTNPAVTIAGTARDNLALDFVEWQLNNGPFHAANGTNPWLAQITLEPGANTVRIRSVDRAGNVSLPATRFLRFVTNSILTVTTSGQGVVTPNLNGRLLEIGNVYSLAARPAAGSIFSGWDGAPFQGARLNFIMQPNLTLQANFITNPFPSVQGTFTGLVLNTNLIAPENSGFITLRVSNVGAFSGRILIGGASIPLSGRFNATGEFQTAVLRRGRPPFAIKLNLDLTNHTGTVTGTVTDGAWISELLANRNTFTARTNPAFQFGTYSFTLVSTNEPVSQLAAVTASIAANGNVTFRGTMHDKRRFSSSVTLAANGDAAFCIPLNAHELLIGWLNFSEPPVVLSGEVVWMKSGTNGISVSLAPR